MDIFKLVGSVFVDTDQANQSLSKTDEKAEGLGNKLLKGAGTAAKWGAGLVTAAGAVGASMIASAKSTASNLDVIDKASQRMGVSAEEYQKLAYAADLSGVSTSQLEAASKKLKKSMGDDADLQQYLIDLANMEDVTARNEKASELFGAAVAQDLVPMLNAGGEGLASMMGEAESLGLVMSNDAVAAGAQMNDSFTKITDTVDSLKNQVGAYLMPIIQKLLDWIIEHIPEIQEFVGKAFETISGLIEEVKPIIEGLMPVVKKVFEYFQKLWNTVLKPVFTGIVTFLDGVFTGDWKKIFEGLGTIVKAVFDGLIEIVKKPINAIIDLLNKAIDGFNKIKIPDWVPLVGGKGLDIPHIPGLKDGGKVQAAGTVLVGEEAPELVTLPRGARVTPLDHPSVGGFGNEKQMERLIERVDRLIEAVEEDKQFMLNGREFGRAVRTYA